MSNPAADSAPDSLQAAVRRRTARRFLVPYLVAQAIVLLAYCTVHLVVPVSSVDSARSCVFIAARFVDVAGVVVGVRAARTAVRREWRLILGTTLVWFFTDLGIATLIAVQGAFPSWLPSGVLALLGYTLMGWAMVRLARVEGMRRGAAVWLESAVVGLSYLLTWWVVIGHDVIHRKDFGYGTVLSNLYPIGDVVIIGGAVVLLGSRSGRALSARLLVLACFSGIIGDLAFGLYIDNPQVLWSAVVPLFWLVQYALLGFAALRSYEDRGVSQVDGATPASVVALVGATVTPASLLAVVSAARGTPPDAGLVTTLLTLTCVMVALTAHRVRRLVQRIELQARELESTARTDELTQLPNRRAGVRLLAEEVQAVHDGDRSRLAVAILDLDHFKDYNDAHGHLQGNRLLRAAGLAWGTALGGRGVLYRHGGEEFVAILPGCDAEAAEQLVASLRTVTPRGQNFSAGLATLRRGEDALQVLARADASLYEAKAAGRGRTALSA